MTNEKTAARRERRVAARKAQILDAAAKMFAEKGFARATTREIADAADVSEGTIYNYFDSKEELLIGIMSRLGEAELHAMMLTPEMLEQALLGDLRDYLTAMVRARQEFVTRNRPMLQAVVSEVLVNPKFSERYYQRLLRPRVPALEQHFRTRIEQGQMRPVNVPLAVRYFSAINLGLLGLLIMGDPLLESEWESEELVQELVSFIFDGIGAREETQE